MNKIFLKVSVAVIALIAVSGLGISSYVSKERSFDPYKPTSVKPSKAKQLIIGLVGDSWVAGRKLDKTLALGMKKRGMPCLVLSNGHPGAVSRAIYRDLYTEPKTPFSSKSILVAHPQYLIVIAGVNDTATHIGKDFYVHHILNICRAARDAGAQPIILEVPEYDIVNTPPVNFASGLKRPLFQHLFDNDKSNVIEDYRAQLRSEVAKQPMAERPILLPFRPFVPNFFESKRFYSNELHLNDAGNAKLSDYIASSIAQIRKKG